MLDSSVWVLAAVTGCCVAALAVMLLVGPLLRSATRAGRAHGLHREELTAPLGPQG